MLKYVASAQRVSSLRPITKVNSNQSYYQQPESTLLVLDSSLHLVRVLLAHHMLSLLT